MATKLDDISEAIGELRAEVKNLGQKIDRADQNALDTSNKAAEHRFAIHKRVEEIADEVGEVKTDMNPNAGYYFIPLNHPNYKALVDLLYLCATNDWNVYARTKETLSPDGFAEVSYLVQDFNRN